MKPLLALIFGVSLSAVNHAQDLPFDFLRDLQTQAIDNNHAAWGRWGTDSANFTHWKNHSNRLVPIYTFGLSLEPYTGKNSVYRDAQRLQAIYHRLPDATVHPDADYMDQTEVLHLQQAAIDAGKKYVFLIIFDGMDWQTTQAAAIYRNAEHLYDSGRGQGLAFQDYDGMPTDFGYFVSSPHNSSTKVDVNAQVVTGRNERFLGGYNPLVGGFRPWDAPTSYPYLIGKESGENSHAYTDSAASATSMTCGIKTFNGAINVDHNGEPVVPLARKLQEQGFGVGVVTSVPFSHATSACAYANNVSRNDYQDLSRDLLGLPSIGNRQGLPGMDVVLGGGWGDWPQSKSAVAGKLRSQGLNYEAGNDYLTSRDLQQIDAEQGGQYQIAMRQPGVSGKQTLQEATRKARAHQRRLFGFFGTEKGNLPYATADGDYQPTRGQSRKAAYTWQDLWENPTLADLTSAALSVLETNDKGFWLLIEPGDVDWANHDNNIDNSIGAVFSGEASFQAVVQWIERNECWQDAAIILTADHGHLFVLEDPQALTPDYLKIPVGN